MKKKTNKSRNTVENFINDQALNDAAQGPVGLKTQENPNAHAIANAAAAAHLETIVGYYKMFQKRQGDNGADAMDKLIAEINEYPLEVAVRDGWRNPCNEAIAGHEQTPEEFYILLSTGGPACRVYGTFDKNGEPMNVELQWQDWGTPWTTPWTTLIEQVEIDAEAYRALEWFASQFFSY